MKDEVGQRWRVCLLDTKASNPNHYLCIALQRALEESPDVEKVVKVDYYDAVHEAIRNECNLLIAFDGEELREEIVGRLVSLCGRSILWVTEDPYELDKNVRSSRLFDLVFTNDAGSTKAYGEKGRALALAADRRFHFHRIPQAEDDSTHYRYDLFFAGTAWPNRVKFLKEVEQEFSDLKMKLALPHNPYIPAPNLNIPISEYDWRTPNSEFARFANRSRIVLTLHREFSGSGNEPVSKTPGPRLFEVALAGATQFIDVSNKDIDIDSYLSPGIEYVPFDGVDDCTDKLRYYLEHSSERIAIARASQQRVEDHHLYTHRVETIMAELAKLPARQEPISTSSTHRIKVLMLSHNLIGVQPYGGVEVYQDAIRKNLSDRFEFMFYVPDRALHPLGQRAVLYDEHLNVVEDFEFKSQVTEFHLASEERERAFYGLLSRNGVDVVHIQHLIGHSPSLAMVPRALGIPTIFSFHDYFAICNRFNLIGYKNKFCDVGHASKSACDICLNAGDGIEIGSQAKRRAFFGRVLETMDILHANTSGVADLFSTIYPLQVDRKKLEILGVPSPDKTIAELPIKKSDGVLRVAIPGNFTRNKGGDDIIHALNLLRHDPIEFTIYGSVSEHYRAIFAALGLKNVHAHGSYKAGELVDLLSGNDLSLHYSIWPETYCITLTEAWQAGLVPIVSDIGALGERVEHGVNGFKIPPEEPGALVELLRGLYLQRTMIAEMSERIHSKQLSLIEDHFERLGSVYSRLASKKDGKVMIPANIERSLSDLGLLLNSPLWTQESKAVGMASGKDSSHANVDGNVISQITPALPIRAYRYLRRHGVKALVKRTVQEFSK